MSKSNKELAIEVAVAFIHANPKTVSSNNVVKPSIDLKSITNVIKGVTQTLDEIDAKTD